MSEDNKNVDECKDDNKKRCFPKILLIAFLFIIFGAFSVLSLTTEDINEVCNVNGSVLYKNSSIGGNWSCATIPIGLTKADAEIHFHNDTGGVVVALTEDVWNNMTPFDTDYSGQFLNGFTYSNSVLTAGVSGLYSVNAGVTFSGTPNNKYHTAIGLNGVQQLNTEAHDRISTGTDVLGASNTGFLNLNVDDEITYMMMNEGSSGDGTVLSANLNLVRIND